MTFLTANVNIIRKVEGRNLLFEEVIAAKKMTSAIATLSCVSCLCIYMKAPILLNYKYIIPFYHVEIITTATTTALTTTYTVYIFDNNNNTDR